MTGQTLFLIELVLVFGGVIGWAVWELWSLRRSQARDLAASAERARHTEGQHPPHDG
jgi:cbb3-type cytochrome oxidase maturation protein